MRVVGTELNVHRCVEAVSVSFKQGTVELIALGKQAPSSVNSAQPSLVRIDTKQRLIASLGGDIVERGEVADDVSGAWRQGRLEYQNVKLSDIVADTNRYYEHDITGLSNHLAAQKITASFKAGRIAQVLDTLALALTIEIERTPYGFFILKEKKVNNQQL